MKKRLLSILMALALLLSLLPTAALAASDPDKLVFDISEGSVIIDESTKAGTIKVAYGNGQVKDGISSGETLIVTGSFAKAEGDEAAHQLAVNTSANIIARDLTIDNTGFDGCCAMSVSGEAADVTLSLEGENTFTAGSQSPCLVVTNGSTLTIAGDGSVTAQGGGVYGSAGIIAYYGNIIISGGTVNAIGGETETEGSITQAIAVKYGSITVSGGTVNATGGTVKNVPGDSTGIFAREADIIITGGKVNAIGEDVAADENRSIGINAEFGSITISGGEVNATGGAVTGNHCWSWGIHTSNSDLTMSDGKVNATSGAVTGENSQSSGIYAGGDIVFNGGTVEANGGAATGKDGISSGICADGDITVSGTADVTARGGDIPLADNAGGEATAMVLESFGIFAQEGDVTINGGTLEAAGGNHTAWSMGIHSRGEGKVTVNGGTLNATGGHTKYTASNSCAISYGISGNGLTVNGGTVTVTSGDVYGNSPESLGITVGQVTITAGTVTAEGGAATAKWGGVSSGAISSWGDIEISGGTVAAEGGSATFDTETEHDPGDCASSFGIRSGHNIEISGGTVEATGGAAETESYGVNVQYNYYPDYGESDGGYLTISGGEVNATGGAADTSLGICTRVYRYDMSGLLAVEPGTIAITGGRVTARTPAGESASARMALNAAPILPDVYWWRTAETDAFTDSAIPYIYSDTHTYAEFVVGHILTKTEAKEPTCTEDGNSAYWTCTLCGKYFSDEAGTAEIEKDSWVIPATGHIFSNGTCIVCGYCDGGENCPSGKFVDVNPKEWYHPYVDYAVTHGLFGGTSENTFEPETAMTRAMLVTVLWRYEGQPEAGKNTFSDVPNGQWYTNAVAWAAENGVVCGIGNNRFDPDGEITREQMATILFRYAEKKGIDTNKRGSLNIFSDEKQLSAYAKDAVQWAVAEQIINGSDGKLLPQGSATRAQVATILMRFIENIVK